jgi:hypothetical protein
MPGLVPGIHVLVANKQKGMDGRDQPGHDAESRRDYLPSRRFMASSSGNGR